MIICTFLLQAHFLDNQGKANKEFGQFQGEGREQGPLGIFLGIIRKGDEMIAFGKGGLCSSIPHFHEISQKRNYKASKLLSQVSQHSPSHPKNAEFPQKKGDSSIESLLRIVQSYNQMSLQKIILSRKKSISNIIQSCDAHSRLIFRKVNRLELPRLHQSCSQNPESRHIEDEQAHQDHPLSLPKAKLRPGKLIDLSYSIQKAQFDKNRVKVQPFCASVNVSRPNKDLFRHVIHKYKRNFHPSNASKGERNTSNDPIIKTPRKIRQLRERYHTQQNETQLRRMVILNQVINENNRKEIRLRQQKSQVRHKLIQ